MNEWAAEILSLTERVMSGRLSVDTFCSIYETLWNFDRDYSGLTDQQQSALADLFQTVAWFTPVEEDRNAYPGFKGEEEVIEQIRSIQKVLHP